MRRSSRVADGRRIPFLEDSRRRREMNREHPRFMQAGKRHPFFFS